MAEVERLERRERGCDGGGDGAQPSLPERERSARDLEVGVQGLQVWGLWWVSGTRGVG